MNQFLSIGWKKIVKVINIKKVFFVQHFSLTKQKSIPEIIPTTAKGLIGSTPNVTSSPVIGAFCDIIHQKELIWEWTNNSREQKVLICKANITGKPKNLWMAGKRSIPNCTEFPIV